MQTTIERSAERTHTILAAVRSATGVEIDSLRSQERTREILYARYVCIKLLHENGDSMERIAAYLHRSRQGVSKSLQAHEQLFPSDYLYRNTFQIASINAALLQNVPISNPAKKNYIAS